MTEAVLKASVLTGAFFHPWFLALMEHQLLEWRVFGVLMCKKHSRVLDSLTECPIDHIIGFFLLNISAAYSEVTVPGS